MAEVLLFHHAQGLTPGIRAFADELRAAGHTVHTPDLFDGQTFGSIEEGMAHIESQSASTTCAPAASSPPTTYRTSSSTRVLVRRVDRPGARADATGARGALLFYSCIPISGEWAFGPWPDGVPVQIHGMDNDPIFVGEGDIDAAREIVETVEDAELFLYPGDQHYFADNSLPSYDAEATALLMNRVLEFLARSR